MRELIQNRRFLLIWLAQTASGLQRQLDQVLVIPTTSFKPTRTIENKWVFNIGKVDFLQNETVVLLSQITTISRRRILRTKHVNSKTQEDQPARLNRNQIERIKDGLRVLFLGEVTLFEELLNSYQDRLPLLEDPHGQYSHLHRPVIRVSDNIDELEYALYCNPKVTYRIRLIPTSLRRPDRKRLLQNWASALEAERDVAYNAIISAMKNPV